MAVEIHMMSASSHYPFFRGIKKSIYLSLTFFCSFFFTDIYAQTSGNKRIAVLELSNPARLSKQEVTYLSDLIRQLASSKLAQEFLVMDKANILTLLPPDIDLETCVGQCAVETGRLLQAAYIITGDILRFGKQLRITIKVHDTRSGQLIGSEIASGKEIMEMEIAIQEAGKKLLQRLIKKSKPLRKMINEQTVKKLSSASSTFQSQVATLEVSTVPDDLRYKINKEVYEEGVEEEIIVGKTYQVIAADPCFESSGEEVITERSGDIIKVDLQPKSLLATLDLKSHSQQGEPVEAEVYVDGKKLGKTPGTYKVSICSETVRLSHPIYGDASQDLTLNKGEHKQITMLLQDTLTEQKKLFSTLMWSATALAIASFSVSLYGYFQASSIKENYDSTDPNNDQDDFEKNKNLADLGATGALVSGGAALLFYILTPDDQPQSQIGLSITKDMALTTYLWRW